MIKTILLSLVTVVLLSLNFIKKDINATSYATPPYDQKEKLKPELSGIHTLDELDEQVNKVTTAQHILPGSVEYVAVLESVISDRFYHGFSHQSLRDNWTSAMAEKFFNYGLSCNVKAEEILKYPYAACSQQCIVMMEILKRRKIDYRSVGFPHHYTLEAKLAGQWYFFDPNMEPNIPLAARLESSWGGKADNLKKYYDGKRFSDLDYKFGKGLAVTFGNINETPAKNAMRFQSATSVFSKIAFCFPLTLLLYRKRKAVASVFSFAGIRNFIQAVWLILSHKPKYKFN